MSDSFPVTPPPTVPESLRKASLSASVKDGMAWAWMHGAGERYIHPAVVYGGSGWLGFAAISAVPTLAGALVQCFAANVADAAGRRKRMFVLGAIAQALMWLPAAYAAYLPSAPSYVVMLCAYVAILGLHNFTIPPWNSLMGDLVPAEGRGRYFGTRNFLVGAGIVATFLGGGFFLQWCEGETGPGRAFGFWALFTSAAIARLVSALYLARMHEPEYVRKESDLFSIADFVRRAPHGNFGRFTFYAALLHFGVGLAGPFFAWYMLKPLGFSTLEFALLWSIHLLSFYGSQPLWGRIADRIGNKRVIAIGGLTIAGIPALWLVSTNFWFVAFIKIYDGLVWAAFQIAAGNYMFDVASAPKRARCTAYYTLFVSLGSFCGAFAGAGVALAVEHFSPVGAQPFTIMLALSCALRLLPGLLLLRSFEEVRLRPAPDAAV